MKKKMNNKGFSLVELIIVIAIMAVLVAVLAPQYIKFVEKSRESTDLDNVQAIKVAVEACVADKQLGTGDTFVIQFNTGTMKIDVTVPGTASLASYGVDVSNLPLKSKEWTGTCKWTYSNYQWDNSQATGQATYLKCDGTEVP